MKNLMLSVIFIKEHFYLISQVTKLILIKIQIIYCFVSIFECVQAGKDGVDPNDDSLMGKAKRNPKKTSAIVGGLTYASGKLYSMFSRKNKKDIDGKSRDGNPERKGSFSKVFSMFGSRKDKGNQ